MLKTYEEKLDTMEGFKKSKIGWIPEDWNLFILKDVLIDYKLGGNYGNSQNESNIPLIKMGNLGRGNMVLDKLEYLSENETIKGSDILYEGDVLFNTRNTLELVGKVAIWKNELIKAVYNSNLLRLKFNDIIDNNDYMNYCLNSYNSLRELRRVATGTTSVAAIYTKDLLNIKIPIPPLLEQRKIASILSDWDEAIKKTQTLIKKLELRKKGLIQDLLTGKTRLTGFKDEWKESKLGNYFTERKEMGYDNLELLSVGRNGVYPQDTTEKKDTSNSNKSKYKRICVGDIGYNTMRMWQGRSALSSLEGIVSPAYTILKPKEHADSVFFSYLFKLEAMIHKFYRNSQGMVSDTWMCKFKDLAIIKFNAPSCKEEQTAIANVLKNADQEIELQKKYLEQLQTQKKGLMQQLLTGKIRVEV